MEPLDQDVAGASPPTVDSSHDGPVALLDGPEQKLDPRWVGYRRLVRWIGVAVLAFGWLVVNGILLLAGVPGLVVAGVALTTGAVVALLAVMAQVWPAWEWAHASYRLDDGGIEIRRGVWWRRASIYVPRSRVQHTNVTQGPLERSFGLGTLVLFTAGTDHSRVALPGLAYEDASALRDRLAAVDDDAL